MLVVLTFAGILMEDTSVTVKMATTCRLTVAHALVRTYNSTRGLFVS